ncbi:MAG: BON domain-containing protein [Pedobacter sp.]|nr:BON domain-containing protein [Pedobacter sp.]
MSNDEKLQNDVEKALKWEPLLVGAEIAVTSRDGIVTLTGTVDTYAKKRGADHATKTVKGVKAVIEKIEVKFASDKQKSDSLIASEVLGALKFNLEVPEDKIQVQVENGWVMLEGTVKWNAQKQAAIKCIEHIGGIKAIANHIIIKSATADEVEKLGIQDALIRNWAIDENNIKVSVFENTVILSGTVHSIFQKDEAERMAWNAPGVWTVHNELVIDYMVS